ncbi:MAG: T9SS type A sorting domain-containing protein [Bacteroidetes bacterium]|nr:T9SS type A sorting domain-containing protein [Bacteroidota bacterium]
MKGKILLVFVGISTILISSRTAQAQERVPFCGSDVVTRQLAEKDSTVAQAIQLDLEQLTNLAQNPDASKLFKKKAVVTIPVVFHVIHNYGPENISKAQILEQMEILNKDFRRRNSDTSKTRSIFKDRAVDCEVEFKLATKDPDGNCTDGITRTVSALTYGGDEDVKDLIRWDYKTYLNIWVVERIDLTIDGATLAGYTYRPPSTNEKIDGILVDHSFVGSSGTSNTLTAGRVLTHEIGHWLGLLHPFTDGCGSNCQTTGDYVCDTPPVAANNVGCPSTVNSCSNDSPDEPDNHENYMDYTNGSCQNMFTAGQNTLMQFYLSRTQYRGANISSAAITKSGITISNPCAPKADFQITSDLNRICPGGEVTFADMSWNGDVVDRVWTFEGGSPSSSTFSNPSVTYNQAGTYKVTLKVTNSKGESSITKEEFITVVPEEADLKSPFLETFESEFTPSYWGAEVDAQAYGWKIQAGPSVSGSKSAVCEIDANTESGARYNLLTPNFDLSAHKDLSPILSFRVAYSLRTAGAGERLVVYGSKDCGENWLALKGLVGASSLYSKTGNNPGWKPSSAADWKVVEVNLDQHGFADSKNLMVRFEAVSASGNSIYIDDVNVDQFALSVAPSQLAAGIRILPNPSNGQFTIHNQSVSSSIHIEVTDANGRVVRTLASEGNMDRVIHLNQSGIYFVRITGDGFVKTERIIVTK